MKFILIISCYLLLLVAFDDANSALSIDITRGNSDNTSIAVSPFYYVNNIENELRRNIINILRFNFNNTGLFRFISDKSYNLETDSQALPVTNHWKSIKATVLLTGSIKELSDNTIELKFRLWDILSDRQLSAKSLIFNMHDWRRAAHVISDDIYTRLTGEVGYFDTKISYIAEILDSKNNHITRKIAIMDQDGHNNINITNGDRFVMTPRFSPDAKYLVYMSYINRKGRIILRNLLSDQEMVLGDFNGISSAPRFSPDGKSVLISESINGRTNIYKIGLKNNKLTKLTNDLSINTSASYSPNEKFIVFNSDRSGSQQLYVMNADGSNQRRISFSAGRYATPVWSPRGDWIAFTKMRSGKFYIGIMRPDGSGERLLSEGYLLESPSWSSNGRIIIFTKYEKSIVNQDSYFMPRLYSIDLTGVNEMIIHTPTYASTPNWSFSLNYKGVS